MQLAAIMKGDMLDAEVGGMKGEDQGNSTSVLSGGRQIESRSRRNPGNVSEGFINHGRGETMFH